MKSARNLRIQLLVLRILRRHTFRVHKNAAPLKQAVDFQKELRRLDPSAFIRTRPH